MKPIIGIVGIDDYSIKQKSTICIFENYRKAIINYGGTTIIILPPKLIDYYKTIRSEIEKYSDLLKNKKEVIVANKMDLPDAQENLERFKNKYKGAEIIKISCMDNTGIDNLIETLAKELEDIPEVKLYEESDFKLYKFEDTKPYQIKRDGNIWIVSGKEIETLLKMTKFEEDEGARRFARKFKGMGIEDELESLGAKPGDEVQILDYMFTFKDDEYEK